jgi:integrase
MTGPTKAATVWSHAKKKLAPSKEVDLDKEVTHVLKYLETEATDLYTGTPPPRRNEEDIIQLARELSRNVPESRARVRFHFLGLGFEIGNKEHGWHVPLVPQLVRVKKVRNWATVENFTRRVIADRLELAFAEALEQPPAEDLAGNLGQVLFTAVFFGGLLERTWLEPFLEAVIHRDFFQHKGIIWVELTRKNKAPSDLPAESAETTYTKRFFPDNFTAAQLYRLLDLGLLPYPIPCPRPWDLLQSYLKNLPGISDLPLPANLTEFMKLAVSRNLYLPGSMLSYATGALKSTSLAIEPWLRCISGKAVINSRPDMTNQLQIQTGDTKVTPPKKYSFRRQETLFKKLLKEIGPVKGKELSTTETKAVFERMLGERKSELSPAFQLMLLWGKQLLSPRSSYLERRSKREALTTRSVRRYFGALGSAFLLAAENSNLTNIDQVELELIYEQVIEDRQSDAKAAQCLCQFHGYLMAFFGLPPIESLNLKGSTSSPTNQNANLITLDLYDLVLRGLGWGKRKKSRWQLLQVIAWVICYRCGLRPSEVLNLRLIDVQMIGNAEFEILVRVAPKTERGRRRVPASLCMTPDESRLLLDYYGQRGTEVGLFGDHYLLAHPEQKTGRLLDEAIFEPARQLLRTITKDDTLVLYHARHTFNSCLQAQFQLKGKPLFGLPGLLDLDTSITKDQLLRATLMANEHWGRKDQHIQGILVGHASPVITNQYYNHLNDVLLGTLVRQRRDMVPVSLTAIATLGGIRQSWAGELLAANAVDHPLARLVKTQAKKHSDMLEHPLLDKAVPMSLPNKETLEKTKLPPWEEVITPEIARELKRGEGNWDFAFHVYERARQTKGKQFNSVAATIQELGQQLKNSNRRWRGPIYKSITELRSVLVALQQLGVPRELIVLVHHPRRGQDGAEQTAAGMTWQEKTNIKKGCWFVGEPANATAPKKGIIELRVVNTALGERQTGKLPTANRGFELVVKLLAKVLLTFKTPA